MNYLSDKLIDLDLDRKVRGLLAEGRTWKEIGQELGYEKHGLRRFTPEEDDVIRREMANNTPIQDIAASLNRDCGTVRQRIFHYLKIPRDGAMARLIRKYGYIPVLEGETPRDAADRIRAAAKDIEKQAKIAADEAKKSFVAFQIKQMHDKIAAGNNRNDAIFECRAAGVKLEVIGRALNMTRSRVKQIHSATAIKRAVSQQFSLPAERAVS